MKTKMTSDFCVGWFYENMSQARVISEGRTSIERLPLLDWPIENLWCIFMTNDWCGRVQLIVWCHPCTDGSGCSRMTRSRASIGTSAQLLLEQVTRQGKFKRGGKIHPTLMDTKCTMNWKGLGRVSRPFLQGFTITLKSLMTNSV